MLSTFFYDLKLMSQPRASDKEASVKGQGRSGPVEKQPQSALEDHSHGAGGGGLVDVGHGVVRTRLRDHGDRSGRFGLVNESDCLGGGDVLEDHDVVRIGAVTSQPSVCCGDDVVTGQRGARRQLDVAGERSACSKGQGNSDGDFLEVHDESFFLWIRVNKGTEKVTKNVLPVSRGGGRTFDP